MADPYFHDEPDPALPGWHRWDAKREGGFNELMGPLRVRREGERTARLRMMPTLRHANLADGVHGGIIMALTDVALFAAATACGVAHAAGGSTVDLGCQFIAPARLDEPLDAVTELLRETGRMAFLRGLVEQGGMTVASYAGTIRKASPPK